MATVTENCKVCPLSSKWAGCYLFVFCRKQRALKSQREACVTHTLSSGRSESMVLIRYSVLIHQTRKKIRWVEDPVSVGTDGGRVGCFTGRHLTQPTHSFSYRDDVTPKLPLNNQTPSRTAWPLISRHFSRKFCPFPMTALLSISTVYLCHDRVFVSALTSWLEPFLCLQDGSLNEFHGNEEMSTFTTVWSCCIANTQRISSFPQTHCLLASGSHSFSLTLHFLFLFSPFQTPLSVGVHTPVRPVRFLIAKHTPQRFGTFSCFVRKCPVQSPCAMFVERHIPYLVYSKRKCYFNFQPWSFLFQQGRSHT